MKQDCAIVRRQAFSHRALLHYRWWWGSGPGVSWGVLPDGSRADCMDGDLQDSLV
jgi:hypothetical protein